MKTIVLKFVESTDICNEIKQSKYVALKLVDNKMFKSIRNIKTSKNRKALSTYMYINFYNT